MLKGIDLSNWQHDLIPSVLSIDFCIAKATEGLGFVDPNCDDFVQNCIENNLLWGFYHFARENEPETEAEFFHSACKNYFGNGIPVLDYETSNYNDVEWCERFITRLHQLTGIWCMIYLSASRIPAFNGSFIPEKCGLWVAGYPYPATEFNENQEMPYDIMPWEFAAIWQFTSSLWSENVDGNYAYMDKEGWLAYAGCALQNAPKNTEPVQAPDAEEIPQTGKTCEQLAQEVIEGKWGDGWNRHNALDSTYGKGTYDHVQCIVNQMLGLDGC